ncbi:PPC domain-containing protein [Wukongibacter baidiensis]
MNRVQKALSMLIGIIFIFNTLATPTFAANSKEELKTNLETNTQENEANTIPFEFNSSVNGDGSTLLELTIDSQNKASSVELTVGENGTKNTIFNGVVNKNHSKIENIELNKVYDFTIRFTENNKAVKVNSKNVSKDAVTDVIERYAGTLKVVQAANGSSNVEIDGLHRMTSVKPDMIEENSVDTNSAINGSSVIETEGLQSTMSAEANTVEKSLDAQEVQLLSTGGQVTQSSLVTTEIEPNSPYHNAQTYTEGDDMYGKIAYQGDIDYYEVTFFQSGVANFWVGMPSDKDYELEIFNHMGSYLKHSYNGKGIDEIIEDYPVAVGQTFYIKVYGATNTDYSSNIQYHLRAKSYPYPDGHEENDTFTDAKSIGLETSIHGNLHSPYDKDYYRFYLSQESKINIKLFDVPSYQDYDIRLYDSNYNLLATSDNINDADEYISEKLASGTYYVRVYGKNLSYHKDYYGLRILHWKVENQVPGSSRTKYVLDDSAWVWIEHVITKEKIDIFGLYVNPNDPTDFILTQGRPHLEGHPVGLYYRSHHDIYNIEGVRLYPASDPEDLSQLYTSLNVGIAYAKEGYYSEESTTPKAYFVAE